MYSLLKKTFIIIFFCASLLIGCSENLPPEKKAMEIAKDSYVLSEDKPVYRFIEEYIRQKGDDVKPGGWEAERKTDNKYIVSYRYRLFSFTEGIGEQGFFFEVNLDDQSVVDRTSEYLEKMKPLSNAYKSEKDIFKEIVDGEKPIGSIE